jgi:small subunit ribosomal protein S8
MTKDIVADVLNMIRNAIKANKKVVVTQEKSKMLFQVLELMKKYGYIDCNYNPDSVEIIIKNITECRAIKPRYQVQKKEIEKYVRRFLPARNFGQIIISTNKGIMLHTEAEENKIGGCLIAYFY